MRFCPKCKSRLRRGGRGLECAACGHSEKAAEEAPRAAPPDPAGIDVIAEGEGREALPTIDKECEKCGHGEAVWWMLQTRSADEPTTQFFRCTSCGNTWRDYS